MNTVVPFKTGLPAAEVLTAEQRAQCIGEIRQSIFHAQQVAFLEIGGLLAEARDLYKYDRAEGGFTGFVESLGYSTSFAYDAITVYERLGRENVSAARKLSRKALIALARPSTPEVVRVEVMHLAVSGETVTAADIARLKDEAKQKAAAEERARKRAEEEAAAAKQRADELANENDRLKATAEETAKTVLEERYGQQIKTMQEEIAEKQHEVDTYFRKARDLIQENAALEEEMAALGSATPAPDSVLVALKQLHAQLSPAAKSAFAKWHADQRW